jgi:hypothetical protein
MRQNLSIREKLSTRLRGSYSMAAVAVRAAILDLAPVARIVVIDAFESKRK